MRSTKRSGSPRKKSRLRAPPAQREGAGARAASVSLSFFDGDLRLRGVLENLRLVVTGLDREGRVKYVNPFFLELTGYELEEVIDKLWVEHFIPARDRKNVSTVFAEFNEQELHAHHENAILTKKGKARLIAWNNSLFRDETGRAIGVLSLGEDITERKRVGAALIKSEEQLKQILETVADGIYLVDQHGHMTFANKAAEKIVGASREQLKHLRYDDTAWKTTTVEGKPFPDDEQPYVLVMKTGKPVHGVEQSIERPDGTRIIVSINAAPLHDAEGNVIGEVGVLTDTTQLKAAEEALAHERLLYNSLMNSSPDRIYFKDEASRFTRINDAQARVLGVSEPGEALGKTDFDFFTPEHARDAFADEQHIIETGTPVIGKLEQVRHAGGIFRWVTATKAPIRDEAGRVIGTFGISRDVTEEKQLEDQLHHVKEYLETLIESANDIIYTLDTQGHFTFANRRAAEVTGYTADEWRGKHFLGLVVPEDRDAVADRVRALPNDQPQSLQFRIASVSQGPVEVSVNSTPIFEHGSVVGTLCIARDMTQTNRLERTIRAERDRLDAILRSMAEGVLVTDANYRLILMNRAAEDLIGTPRQLLIGKELDAISLPITLADLDRQLDHSAPGKGPYSRARPWGSRMLDVAITTLSDTRGQSAGTVSVVRDVTELMRVDQMKSEFISLVSHELRTPLTAVKAYIDLLLAGDAGPLNAQQLEFITIIKANIEHLIVLINDLLDISRIEAGGIKLVPGEVDLTPLIGEIIRSMRPQWEQKSQIVSADLPKTLPPLFADRDRLFQILGNLLSNASKYSPSNTRIRIHANEVEATQASSSDPDLILRHALMQAISVEDEGIGIAQEAQGKLFTKFYRVDNSLTREAGGTGLGLAITKSFVEMHGGRVWVESPLDLLTGRGSRFTFTIPIFQQPSLDQPA